MNEKLDPTKSLLITQLNSKMLNILCEALLKNNGDFVAHQTEISQTEFHINTFLDGFDSRLIVVYCSKKDSFDRISFTLKFITYNSKHVATLNMIFNKNNIYDEGSFLCDNENLITYKLLNFIQENTVNIVTNIF